MTGSRPALPRRVRRSVVLAVLVAVAATHGTASATVLPAKRSLVVRAGKAATVHFAVDARPAIDVALVFDTTGSLGAILAEAKETAAELVAEIQRHVPDARFAVAQFKDKGDTPEYRVEQKMTPSAAAVSAAVNRLTSRGGGDLPEAYNLTFRRSISPDRGGPLGWRSFSRKFVVVVGDAEPHGAGAAGIEGCEDTSADRHGLNTADVLSRVSEAGRTLVMVHVENHHAMMLGQPPASFECYQGLAKAAGGVAVEGHGHELHHSIVHAVTSLVPEPDPAAALDLRVTRAWPTPASRKWATVIRGEAHSPTHLDDGPHDSAAPATAEFTVKIKPPRGVEPGVYRFRVVAFADGVDVGHAEVKVEVRPRKGGGDGMAHH